MQLTGKTILITGASSGMGRGVALALSKRDNNLVVTARRAPLLESLAEAVRANGSRCTVLPADATDEAACLAVVERAVATYGAIDAALINAGGGQAVSLAEASASTLTHEMRLNYDTLAHFLTPLIAHMKPRGGLIAHTSSPAGYFGLPMSGPYSAAKAAGRVLLESARIDLKGTGVRVVTLLPGFVIANGTDRDDVPVKALLIGLDRAVREMVRGMESGRAQHLFPKRIWVLIQLARLLPEPLRRWLLGLG